MKCHNVVVDEEKIRIAACWPAVIHWDDEDFGAKWCTCYDTSRKKRKISQVKKMKLTIKKLKKQLQKCKQQR